MVEQLRTRLELTDQQVEQIQTGMRANFAGLQAGGEGQQPDVQAIRARMTSTIEEVLTPEQLERYRELQSELEPGRRATLWVQTASGQIEPRAVRLGVDDSRVTEIIGDQLNEGDRVVVRVREAS
jgi:multidrug efflux pump subunit AcrA (membrane-fusion protein)